MQLKINQELFQKCQPLLDPEVEKALVTLAEAQIQAIPRELEAAQSEQELRQCREKAALALTLKGLSQSLRDWKTLEEKKQ